MRITQFLDDDTKFDAETKRVMGVAFEMAWVALGLTDTDDQANHIVAKRIIELAKAGERNPDILCEKALKGLRSRRTPKQFQSTTRLTLVSKPSKVFARGEHRSSFKVRPTLVN